MLEKDSRLGELLASIFDKAEAFLCLGDKPQFTAKGPKTVVGIFPSQIDMPIEIIYSLEW